jgi:FtsP/CotA-like multicopper oxidase with cupredoxin domain
MKNCINNSSLCECIHRVKVKLNSVIEFILIDIEDNSKHPFHLHGYKFYVIDSGYFNNTEEDVVKMLKNRENNPNFKPILKDTVTIPNGGFVKIKFKADNPGFWLAHCHFDYHYAIGMGFILQVGEMDEMKEPSKELNNSCSGFIPDSIVI